MPTFVLLWVWVCAYLNCAGWALSALHQLNAGGYAAALALGIVALIVCRKKTSPEIFPRIRWRKNLRRFRRPFPLVFLILAVLAFLGGVLYAPTNYDALAYRVPRILHWLAAERWHWIHSFFYRINNRSCGIEWVSAPFLALLKTDRQLFLINCVSLWLLPGLVFSVFTRLGVRRRVAWHWMWIAPTGYCFLTQAGSIGNDLFGAPFALAALDFALRAKVSRAPRDFFASVLAAAMMTSAKTASLPLLLPWIIAIFPSLKLIFQRPLQTTAVCGMAFFASALPTMVFNGLHSENWSGANLDHSGKAGILVLRTGANVVLIAIENLDPPVFPMAGTWDAGVQKIMPAELNRRMHEAMQETQASEFQLPEMQIEEAAGLGFGVSALLLSSIVAAGFAGRNQFGSGDSVWRFCVRWTPAISLLALMTQYNLSVIARIITPYYLMVLPALLTGTGHEHLLKKSWWKTSAFLVFIMAGGLLAISPARPLFPMQTLLTKMAAHGSRSKLQARLENVYLVYAQRNDAFAPARAMLPPDLKVLGMITYDDPETSLWRPFGSRRIEHVCPGDTAADLKARGIEYILLREQAIGQWFHCPLDDWLKQVNAEVVWKMPLDLRASTGPLDWYLVKLN
jgi:hypothetical protein